MAKNETIEPTKPTEVVEVETVEVVEPVKAETPKAKTGTYIVKDGDSYPSIAAEFAPKGKSKFEYAKELVVKNGGKALIVGGEVVL